MAFLKPKTSGFLDRDMHACTALVRVQAIRRLEEHEDTTNATTLYLFPIEYAKQPSIPHRRPPEHHKSSETLRGVRAFRSHLLNAL